MHTHACEYFCAHLCKHFFARVFVNRKNTSTSHILHTLSFFHVQKNLSFIRGPDLTKLEETSIKPSESFFPAAAAADVLVVKSACIPDLI